VISTVPPVRGSQLALAFLTSCSGVSVVQTRTVVPAKFSAEGTGSIDGPLDGGGAAVAGASLAAALGEVVVPAWHAARKAPADARAPVASTWRRVTGVASNRSILGSPMIVLLDVS
jgi:hypothetical protein